MAAASTLCAVSVPSEHVAGPVPHLVHVRFDSFLVSGVRGGSPQFRVLRKPVPADQLKAILQELSAAVDQDSNCGFYLNFFGSPFLQCDPSATLRRFQLELLKKTDILVSVGAANTKVAAAAASRIAKPGELRVIDPGCEVEFLAALPVEVLHGMEPIDAGDLRRRGIRTVAELRRVPRPVLTSIYGETLGGRLWRNSRAVDAPPEIRQFAPTASRSWLRSAAEAFVAVL